MKLPHLPEPSPRRPLKALLHRAARGDREAFGDLFEAYSHLASEALALSGYTGAGREKALRWVFAELWSRLAYARRLSDFERLLAVVVSGLPQHPLAGDLPQAALAAKLAALPPLHRFGLLAREMENWPLRYVSLAIRLPLPRLQEELLRLRCILCEIPLERQRPGVRAALQRLSRYFDERVHRQGLDASLRREPRALAFHGAWLERRCELVELREELRLAAEERAALRTQLLHHLPEPQQRRRPGLFARLRNALRFGAYPGLQARSAE